MCSQILREPLVEFYLLILPPFTVDHRIQLPRIGNCSLDFCHSLPGLNFAENQCLGHSSTSLNAVVTLEARCFFRLKREDANANVPLRPNWLVLKQPVPVVQAKRLQNGLNTPNEGHVNPENR
jgi:hypothetical protein